MRHQTSLYYTSNYNFSGDAFLFYNTETPQNRASNTTKPYTKQAVIQKLHDQILQYIHQTLPIMNHTPQNLAPNTT